MKRSLTQLDVPINQGGWTTLTEKHQLDKALITHNKKHFLQANNTPFGQKGHLAHTIDPDSSNNEIEKLLE